MPRDKIGHFYYEWYPSIFRADTQHLTLAEDAAYRRLIDHYMETRAPLSPDNRSLARIIGIGYDEWLWISVNVLKFFKNNPAGLLTHTFCDETLAKHASRIAKSRYNGKSGGRPKSLNKINNNPAGSKTITQQQPITEKKASTILGEIVSNKNTPIGVQKGSRFALPSPPKDWVDFCRNEKPQRDPYQIFQIFRDYWIAQPGAKGVKLDWTATWRNWIRRESNHETDIRGNKPNSGENKTDRAKAAILRAAEAGGFAPRPDSEARAGNDDISMFPIT